LLFAIQYLFISFKPIGKSQLKITVYLTTFRMLLGLYIVECWESDIAFSTFEIVEETSYVTSI